MFLLKLDLDFSGSPWDKSVSSRNIFAFPEGLSLLKFTLSLIFGPESIP